MKSRKAFQFLVRNIPWTADRSVLKDHFGQFGAITEISYPLNYETGFYRRFAFIKMKDHAGIEKVLNHDEHVIDNTKVLVLKLF